VPAPLWIAARTVGVTPAAPSACQSNLLARSLPIRRCVAWCARGCGMHAYPIDQRRPVRAGVASSSASIMRAFAGGAAALQHEAKRANIKTLILLINHGGADVNFRDEESVRPNPPPVTNRH